MHTQSFSLGVKLLFAILFLNLWAASPLQAADDDIPDNCSICSSNLIRNVTIYDDQIRDVKRYFCTPCTRSKTKCWACTLPTHHKTETRLPDGRYLCEWDSKGIIIDQKQADALFKKYIRDWQRQVADWPPIPDLRNVRMQLVNREVFIREYRKKPHFLDPELTQGLTQSRRTADGKTEHDIYIISGMLQNQFIAVAAHEYAHAWLFANYNPKRILQDDCEEGFCEWFALSTVNKLGDKLEAARIRASSYTRGQILAFEQAEKRYRTYAVMEWVLKGVDSWLDKDEINRVTVLTEPSRKPRPKFNPLIATGPPRATQVPDVLKIKGISGRGKNRFALINNATLAEGESGKVRVGGKTIKVKCLKISANSVLIHAENETEPRELAFAPRKK